MATREIRDFSGETKTLRQILREMQKGDRIAYDAIERAINLECKSPEFAYVFHRAQAPLRSEGYAFSRRGRDQVIVRLDDAAVVKSVEAGIGRIQRSANTLADAAAAASASNEIGEVDRTRARVATAMATLAATATSAAASEMIRAEIDRTGKSIPLKDTLALFAGRRKLDRGDG